VVNLVSLPRLSRLLYDVSYRFSIIIPRFYPHEAMSLASAPSTFMGLLHLVMIV
jgi:hypothetical protein